MWLPSALCFQVPVHAIHSMAHEAQLAMIGPEIDSKKAIMGSVCDGCLFHANASSSRFTMKDCVSELCSDMSGVSIN